MRESFIERGKWTLLARYNSSGRGTPEQDLGPRWHLGLPAAPAPVLDPTAPEGERTFPGPLGGAGGWPGGPTHTTVLAALRHLPGQGQGPGVRSWGRGGSPSPGESRGSVSRLHSPGALREGCPQRGPSGWGAPRAERSGLWGAAGVARSEEVCRSGSTPCCSTSGHRGSP